MLFTGLIYLIIKPSNTFLYSAAAFVGAKSSYWRRNQEYYFPTPRNLSICCNRSMVPISSLKVLSAVSAFFGALPWVRVHCRTRVYGQTRVYDRAGGIFAMKDGGMGIKLEEQWRGSLRLNIGSKRRR